MVLTGLCFLVLLQQVAGMENVTLFSLLTSHPSVQTEIVNKHNELRRMTNPNARNMLKMTWSDEAAKNAETWVRKCIPTHSPSSERRIKAFGCGENLFKSSQPMSWSRAIDSFYKEKENFKFGFGTLQPNAEIRHYTQLVWANSHKIGCALAHCPERSLQYIYICQYCPEGNHLRSINTPYKAGKPCGDCPDHCDDGLCTNPCMYTDEYSNCADLVKLLGCDREFIKEKCLATCKCPSEIK